MFLRIEQRRENTFFTETGISIYTTGAHIVPMKIKLGQKEKYVRIVDEFNDDSYLDGKCCKPVVYANNVKNLLQITSVLLFAVFLAIASHITQAGAGENTSGVIQGTVTAKKAKYLRDTIAYIDEVPNTFAPPKEHIVMDQKNMAFLPHVLPIVKGTTVDFLNSDIVQHNIYSPDAIADNVNLGTWLKGETRSYTFGKLGIASLRCNVHVDMLAYVLVLQNPYFARVAADGSFSITNVPAGKFLVRLWSERLKAEDQVVNVSANQPARVTFVLK